MSTPSPTPRVVRRPDGASGTAPPRGTRDGAVTFWSVMGDLLPTSFTNDEAGRRAEQIGDRYILYVFPTRTGNPIGLGNNRQGAASRVGA